MADAVGVLIVIILAAFGIMIVLAGAAIIAVLAYGLFASIVAGVMAIFKSN